MDELIIAFIERSFDDHLKQEIYRSFKLFEGFSYEQAYPSFLDLLTYTSYMSPDDVKDTFILELNTKLDFVLEQHTLVVIDTAVIRQKNELLVALQSLMNLEDYTGIIRTLETLEEDYTKLSLILSQVCDLDQMEIMELVLRFNPEILDTLKDFIYKKEEQTLVTDDKYEDIIRIMSIFTKEFGSNSLGYQLIVNNVLLNQEIELYLPFVKDSIIVDDDHATAKNILSLIYISKGGLDNPLLVYREHSGSLFTDLNRIGRIEVEILSMSNKVSEIFKVYKESLKAKQES